MKTIDGFESYDVNYEKISKKHFYEIEWGSIPRSHLIHRVFATDELDAIDRMYDLFPDAIIYEVKKIGR